jgi:DNA invertase Pin-like site-specific DNA recombinase
MVNITKELVDNGTSVRILDMNMNTTTATRTLMVNIFASVAQFERDQMLICQRIDIEATERRTKTYH